MNLAFHTQPPLITIANFSVLYYNLLRKQVSCLSEKRQINSVERKQN